MITKGKITKIPTGKWITEDGVEKYDNIYEVFLPIFLSAGQSKDSKLSPSSVKATLCYQPEHLNSYNVGDVVFVSFEDNDKSKPVILGKLYLGNSQIESRTNDIVQDLKVTHNAKLPKDTTIGDISGEELERLFRDVANNGYKIDEGGGSNYSAGTGIDITNNVISVDNTIATKQELDSLNTIVGDGLYNDLSVTFGTSGNYKDVLDLSNLTEGADYQDNGTTNTQFKQGSKLLVKISEGGKLTIAGYPNYSSYKITINNETFNNLTGSYTTPTALYAQTIIIEALNSSNYYISLSIQKYISYDLSNKVLELDGRHLYEHNFVLADNSDVNSASEIVMFKVLSTSDTALNGSDDVAQLLYSRGHNGIGSCLAANGRTSDDSFSYITDVVVDFSEHDVDFSWGYCESYIVGVYGTNASELKVVVSSLDEDRTPHLSTTEINDIHFVDNVVMIF